MRTQIEMLERLEELEKEVATLRRVAELLAFGCSCSVKERLSGHRIECSSPEIQELLHPSDLEDRKEEGA